MKVEDEKWNLWLSIGGAVFVMVAVATTYYYAKLRPLQEQAAFIKCRSNLKQIVFAARSWAIDHKDKMPVTFLEMKEELQTPRLFACPNDKGNPLREARSWSEFDPARSSYELVSPGMNDGDRSKTYVRCKFHGFACLGDGSVRE